MVDLILHVNLKKEIDKEVRGGLSAIKKKFIPETLIAVSSSLYWRYQLNSGMKPEERL